jgi:hypothetical protein
MDTEGRADTDEATAPGPDGAPAPRRAALDADGMERPAFLLDFPEDPALEALIQAFEAGNYARVRREAPSLAERAESPAVRDAALELRRRIAPDPLARYLIAVSLALLLALTWFAYHAQSH